MNDLEQLALIAGIVTAALIVVVVCCVLHHLDQRQHHRRLEELDRAINRLKRPIN